MGWPEVLDLDEEAIDELSQRLSASRRTTNRNRQKNPMPFF